MTNSDTNAPGAGWDPHATYSARLAQRQAAADALARRDGWLSNARLAVFVGALMLFGLGWHMGSGQWAWGLIPLAGFVALAIHHAQVQRRLDGMQRAATHYRDGVARLEGRWTGLGPTGEHLAPPDHAYARDLDLFGTGSLFERICTARTGVGEAALARWLAEPAAAETVRARQEAVRELRGDLDLREALALLGPAVHEAVHPEVLTRWAAAAPAWPVHRWQRIAWMASGAGLAALGVSLVAGSIAPVLLVMAVNAGLLGLVKGVLQTGARSLNEASRELSVLAGVLERFEAEPFRAPRLRQLQAALFDQARPASVHIRRLSTLADWTEAQRNVLFAIIALAGLVPVHLACAVERWRMRHGAGVAAWLEAVGEFEALAALACYAYENPCDPFPIIAEGPPRFESEGLGHPLLPTEHCARNDVRLGGAQRLLVVSGTNMSGKSTLLRAVGTNAVLAQMGAPVRAQQLTLTPLAIGATIHVQDSIQRGASRFYAEISRLRVLLDAAGSPFPLLFLLDEILHGTNSHDRLVGATALMHAFMARPAIGLITTHDLAVTEVAERVGAAANVHFADTFEGGRLVFDYTLRPGVVREGNAVQLMRSIGLPV